ncbi:MAG: DnaD domain protein [Clostridiales Family XIII bacterium]|jgi:hypothetical protein|nr:DnaD domain protein [Clostridiales Family XIII bacterium]
MNFIKEKIKRFNLNDTLVSNIFISDILPFTPSLYVKIYLYAYMYSGISNIILTNEDITRDLNIKIEEVLACWTYFEERGIIVKHKKAGSETVYTVEFLDLRNLIFSNEKDNKRTAKNDNKKIEDMFSEVANILSKPLTTQDAKKLSSFIEDNEIKPEKIILAYKYLKKPGRSVRPDTVLKTITNWSERGLAEIKDIEKYIINNTERANVHKRIGVFLGMYPPFNPEEIETFNKWLDDYGYSISDIEGLSRNAAGIKSKFQYIRKVIEKQVDKMGNYARPSSDKKKKTKLSREDYYRNKEEENKKNLEIKTAELYAKIPELKNIDNEIKALSFELSDFFMGNAVNKNEKITAHREKIKKLENKKRELFKENKFSENYLEVWTCEKCKDTGYLDDGELCDCFLSRATVVL